MPFVRGGIGLWGFWVVTAALGLSVPLMGLALRKDGRILGLASRCVAKTIMKDSSRAAFRQGRPSANPAWKDSVVL